MTINQAIEYLGFNEKEARVYLSLLSLGQASVYGIANASGIKRPTAYVIIDNLIRKGAVIQILRTRKQHYKAKSPEELVAEAENRLALIKAKLPEIKALIREEETKPRVFFAEGKSGLQKTLLYGLKKMKGKEIVGFYATNSKDTLEKFENFAEFNNKVRDSGIILRGVAPDDPAIQPFRDTDEGYGRKFKTLPMDKYSPTVSIEMGDDFVKIQDWENLQALVIENKNITGTLKQIFEIIWKSA
jgi:sugar-specific transcriptional regulator TrmB